MCRVGEVPERLPRLAQEEVGADLHVVTSNAARQVIHHSLRWSMQIAKLDRVQLIGTDAPVPIGSVEAGKEELLRLLPFDRAGAHPGPRIPPAFAIRARNNGSNAQ